MAGRSSGNWPAACTCCCSRAIPNRSTWLPRMAWRKGVASVVSTAIDWAPKYWQACADTVLDIARVGRQLLRDPDAAADGYRALQSYTRGPGRLARPLVENPPHQLTSPENTPRSDSS